MEIVIRPQAKWWAFNWKEMWGFRELLYFFAWRDFKVKYKQTLIGVLWAIFQPFVTMVVFSVFFGALAKMPSDGVPYPIFVYTGLLFWTLFANNLSMVSNAFLSNQSILTKIYFPRIFLPVSAATTGIIDFFFALIIFVGMMIYYQYLPSLAGILLFPFLLLMTLLTSFGIGLFFASVNVKFRDVRYVLPFFIQIIMFVTPVIYPASLAAGRFKWILGLNPMSGVIETARAGLLGTIGFDWTLLAVSFISMLIYCIFGLIYFKNTERYFADII